jgi:hypothetical protein
MKPKDYIERFITKMLIIYKLKNWKSIIMIILYPIYAEDKKSLNPWIYSTVYLTSAVIHHNPVLTSNCQRYNSRQLQYAQYNCKIYPRNIRNLHITITYVKMRYNCVVYNFMLPLYGILYILCITGRWPGSLKHVTNNGKFWIQICLWLTDYHYTL